MANKLANLTSESSSLDTETVIKIENFNDETKEFEFNEDELSIFNHETINDKLLRVIAFEGFKIYLETFEDKKITEPKLIRKSISEAKKKLENNYVAIRSAENLYVRKMEEICGDKKPFVNPVYLKTKHIEIINEAISYFDDNKLGDEEFSNRFIDKLVRDLWDQFNRYMKMNDNKNFFSFLTFTVLFVCWLIFLFSLSAFFFVLFNYFPDRLEPTISYWLGSITLLIALFNSLIFTLYFGVQLFEPNQGFNSFDSNLARNFRTYLHFKLRNFINYGQSIKGLKFFKNFV